MREINTLIIDDDILIVWLIRTVLMKSFENANIKLFTNPIDALAFLKTYNADIVFTDYNMPECCGSAIIDYVTQCLVSTEVVVVSSEDDECFQRHLINAGALAYIQKPFTANEIRNVIHQYYVHRSVRKSLC